MESFFLAETVKYLYLLFDPDNFIHNDGSDFDVVITPYGECILNAGGYVFNTEAHPIDPAALHCCRKRKEEQWEVEDLMQEFYSLQKNKKFPLKQTSDCAEGGCAKDPAGASLGGKKRNSKKSSHSLLSCPSQSFNSKLAVLGQVFLDNTWLYVCYQYKLLNLIQTLGIYFYSFIMEKVIPHNVNCMKWKKVHIKFCCWWFIHVIHTSAVDAMKLLTSKQLVTWIASRCSEGKASPDWEVLCLFHGDFKVLQPFVESTA